MIVVVLLLLLLLFFLFLYTLSVPAKGKQKKRLKKESRFLPDPVKKTGGGGLIKHGVLTLLFPLQRERRMGREPCSVIFCSQTLSVLVVVCSTADTLVIDQ